MDNCLVVLQHHTYSEREQRKAAEVYKPDEATDVILDKSSTAQDYLDRLLGKADTRKQLAEDIMSNIERRVYKPGAQDWAKDEAVGGDYPPAFARRIEGQDPLRQERERRQSRFWITYALHRAVRPVAPSGIEAGEDGSVETEAEQIMRKMADGVHWLFSDERLLASMFVFGQKLEKKTQRRGTADLGSAYEWVNIKKPRKPEREPFFYADEDASSYMHMCMCMSCGERGGGLRG